MKSNESSSEPEPTESVDTSTGESVEENKKTGCGGAVGAAGVFAALLAVGAVAVCRKSKEDK